MRPLFELGKAKETVFRTGISSEVLAKLASVEFFRYETTNGRYFEQRVSKLGIHYNNYLVQQQVHLVP
jgi:hypothetical protein